MLIYNINRVKSVPVASQDLISISGNATRSYCVLEIDVEGAGTTSAYDEVAVYRVSAVGTTGGGAITPTPVNVAQPAFGGVVNTTWSAQPTVSAVIHSIPVNANGQRYFWRAMPNLSNAIWSPGGGTAAAAAQMSIRPVGTPSGANLTLRVQIGEI